MPEKNLPVLLDQFGKDIVKSEIKLDSSFSAMRGGYSGMTTKDIEQKPYQHHAWIFTCVWTIIKNVSRLPLVLYNEQDPNDLIREHEVLDILNRPNPLMTKTPFIQAILLSLLLPSGGNAGFLGSTKKKGGQCFLVCYGNGDIETVDLTRGQIPILMLPYTDNYIKPMKLTNTGLSNLIGWEFQVPGYPSSKKEFGINEIIRIYQFNPYDWLGGISNYEPARIAMLQDIKSDIHNINLFAKGNVPVGILETDQVVGRKKRQEQLRHWNETMGNPNNESGVAITEKGLKYQSIGLTNLDMQYSEMKEFLQEQFTAVYGLNKIALGKYEEINRATIIEGRRMLWQDTYLPMAQMLEEPINIQWIQYVEKGLRFKFDTSGIPALRPDYTNRAKSAGMMVDKMFLPPILAAELCQIPLPDDALKLYPWLDKNPAELKKISKPGIDDKLDEKEDKKSVIRIGNIAPMEESGKEIFWKNYVSKVLDPSEKKLQSIMMRFFYRQRNLMQDKVDVWLERQTEKAVDRIINARVEDFLFDKDKENAKLVQAFEPIVKLHMKVVEVHLKEELGELIEFQVTDEMAVAYIKERRHELIKINNTTFNRAKEKVNDAIDTAIKENMTPQEAAKEVKTAINKVYNGEPPKVKGRIANSKTIARTEIGSITSKTRFNAFQIEGIEFHEWYTALDEGVRISHQKEHGRVRRIGNIFPYVNMKYPLDPEGHVGEIVNCRCVALAHPGPETV